MLCCEVTSKIKIKKYVFVQTDKIQLSTSFVSISSPSHLVSMVLSPILSPFLYRSKFHYFRCFLYFSVINFSLVRSSDSAGMGLARSSKRKRTDERYPLTFLFNLHYSSHLYSPFKSAEIVIRTILVSFAYHVFYFFHGGIFTKSFHDVTKFIDGYSAVTIFVKKHKGFSKI